MRCSLWCVYELSEFVLLHPGQLESKLQIIGLDWPAWWNPINWSREVQLSDNEIQAIENFSVRAANCERPSDRQHILAELRRSWGSEAAFDGWVREEMKAVLPCVHSSSSTCWSSLDNFDTIVALPQYSGKLAQRGAKIRNLTGIIGIIANLFF